MASLHIGWVILNLGLAIVLLIVFCRNFRTFSERYGLIPSLLVFVLVASMCQSPAKQPIKQMTGYYERVVPFTSQVSHWSTTRSIKLLDLPTLHLTQQIHLNHEHQSDSVRVSSQTMLTGTVIGVSWTPISNFVGISADKLIHYNASGVLDWRLLNFTIYSQSLFFEGKIDLRN